MSWPCKIKNVIVVRSGPGGWMMCQFDSNAVFSSFSFFRMQQMARGGGMPTMESMMSGGMPGLGGMPGMGGGGMPNMGGMPGMGGGGGMPNMGGMPGMGSGGGMPNMGGMDMEAVMRMAQSMGAGGMPPGGSARR
jgi:signal recognition particle subunit SRP54